MRRKASAAIGEPVARHIAPMRSGTAWRRQPLANGDRDTGRLTSPSLLLGVDRGETSCSRAFGSVEQRLGSRVQFAAAATTSTELSTGIRRSLSRGFLGRRGRSITFAWIGGISGSSRQRILFYEATEEKQLRSIDARTTQLQTDLWSTVRVSGASVPLVVIAVNEMLNARGSMEASWTNRISLEAWTLMGLLPFVAMRWSAMAREISVREPNLF